MCGSHRKGSVTDSGETCRWNNERSDGLSKPPSSLSASDMSEKCKSKFATSITSNCTDGNETDEKTGVRHSLGDINIIAHTRPEPDYSVVAKYEL